MSSETQKGPLDPELNASLVFACENYLKRWRNYQVGGRDRLCDYEANAIVYGTIDAIKALKAILAQLKV